jgi:hypothetical protein
MGKDRTPLSLTGAFLTQQKRELLKGQNELL